MRSPFAVVCASPSLTLTLRVHRHRAIPRLLSRCAPSFVVDVHDLLNLLDPSPRLGRGPRCVSSWWAGRLCHHASNPAGLHTPSVGYLLVTCLLSKEVRVKCEVDKRLGFCQSRKGTLRGATGLRPNGGLLLPQPRAASRVRCARLDPLRRARLFTSTPAVRARPPHLLLRLPPRRPRASRRPCQRGQKTGL